LVGRWRGVSGAPGHGSAAFIRGVSGWLWFTVLFANFAEAMAEGRGKAQADSLRQTRRDVVAKKLEGVPCFRGSDDANRAGHGEPGRESMPPHGAKHRPVSASALRKNDVVLVEAGDMMPADGEVIEGVASVDESAITGESAPVIRESGGDRSSVTGGTRVLS